MPKIFISYRRDDSAGHTGRLYDRLLDHFGRGQVFMDVDTVQPGLDYVQVVHEAVGTCDGFIAVIGREWLQASDAAGARRLENPADLVRQEIATALERDIRVVPVLVQGVQMPLEIELPEDLKGLASRNALEISNTRFRYDVDRLIEALEVPTPQQLADSVFAEPSQPVGSVFVGRGRELGTLNTALEHTLAGQGRMVMLAGEPGIGKTRTAQELASRAESNGAVVLWGRCVDEEGAPPYWPWLQALRAYVERVNPEQLCSEMDSGAADIAEIVPEVRVKLPDLEPRPALEPEQARFRLFSSISTFLRNIAQTQPLMLILDDLHWADRASLRFLQFLTREIGESRLLIVGTYRDMELSRQHPLSETLAQLTREPVFQREVLAGLSPDDTGRFIEATAGIRPPQELVETIYSHTEGNPFFMTEVVRLLSEQNRLTPEGAQEFSSISIPEGVREVIGQRLNRLSEQCNEVLTTASIIGREFEFEVLDALRDDVSEEVLQRLLDEALDAHMLEEVPGSWEAYRFGHALVQDTLSEALSTRRRVRLHARIGQALEELYGNNLEAHSAELAHHFAEAEPVLGPEKLVRYSSLAGNRALAAFAWEDAILHFQRALVGKKGEPMDTNTAELLVGSGYAQLVVLSGNQGEEAVEGLNQAFDFYAKSGDVNRAIAAAEYPMTTSSGGQPGTARLVEQALQLAPPDSLAAGRLLLRYGWHQGRMQGDFKGAQDTFAKALAIATGNGDSFLEMQSLAAAAEVDVFNLACQESMVKSRRVIALANQADDPWAEVQAHQRATLACTILGDLEGASHHASAALAPAERLHDYFWLTSSLWGKQFVHRLEGNWEAARETSDRLLLLAESPRNLSERVMLDYQQGDFAQGRAHLERLLAVHRRMRSVPSSGYVMPALIIPLVNRINPEVGHLDYAQSLAEAIISSTSAPLLVTSVARAGLSLLAVLRNDATTAQEHYTAILPLGGTMLHTGVIAADSMLGLLSQTMGNLDQAADHFEDALAFCRKAGYRPELAWTCCDYADTLLQRNEPGDREKAMSLLDESLAISSELGMRPLTERVLSRQETFKA